MERDERTFRRDTRGVFGGSANPICMIICLMDFSFFLKDEFETLDRFAQSSQLFRYLVLQTSSRQALEFLSNFSS
jgi:hypothetical protein